LKSSNPKIYGIGEHLVNLLSAQARKIKYNYRYCGFKGASIRPPNQHQIFSVAAKKIIIQNFVKKYLDYLSLNFFQNPANNKFGLIFFKIDMKAMYKEYMAY
jgi:hypothetical protein